MWQTAPPRMPILAPGTWRPVCQNPMRVFAVVEDSRVVKWILLQLGALGGSAISGRPPARTATARQRDRVVGEHRPRQTLGKMFQLTPSAKHDRMGP